MRGKSQKDATKSWNHGVILKNRTMILRNHAMILKNHAMIPTILSKEKKNVVGSSEISCRYVREMMSRTYGTHAINIALFPSR